MIKALASPSSAKSHGYYKNGPDLTPYLPVTLGEVDGNGDPVGLSEEVATDAQARDVLQGYQGPQSQAERAVARLKAQLLAVRLNIIRADELFGEPLETARVLGTMLTVTQVVAAADALLAAFNDIADLAHPDIVQLNETQVLLEAINSGQVTYLAL